MKFNKFLSICLASSLAFGTLATSCSKDDDKDDKKETTNGDSNIQDDAKVGRADGVKLAESYTKVMDSNADAFTRIYAAGDMSTLAKKYKEQSTAYKSAFAEGAVATNRELDDSKLQEILNEDYTELDQAIAAIKADPTSLASYSDLLLKLLTEMGGSSNNQTPSAEE